MKCWQILLFGLAILPACLFAENEEPLPGAASATTPVDPVVIRAQQLAGTGKLTKAETFEAQLAAPKLGPIDLPPAGTRPLKGREIADRARLAHVRVGWFYHCTRCNNWHLSAAGGYAIAKDTVATAFHVLQEPENMKKGDGYPVVIRGETEVIPITMVLAADRTMDAIVVRVGTSDLQPLALTANARVGDAAYCYSDPHNTRGYFSDGIVNRLYALGNGVKPDPRLQRMNVSTDWSPGSSGSAVLDECGNVIGHVARIESISRGLPAAVPMASPAPRMSENPTFMNLHEAIPAKAVLSLLGRVG